MVRHIQDKNDKKLKKQNDYKSKKKKNNEKTMKSQKQRMKNVVGFSLFLILVSQNKNSVLNRGFLSNASS